MRLVIGKTSDGTDFQSEAIYFKEKELLPVGLMLVIAWACFLIHLAHQCVMFRSGFVQFLQNIAATL